MARGEERREKPLPPQHRDLQRDPSQAGSSSVRHAKNRPFMAEKDFAGRERLGHETFDSCLIRRTPGGRV